MNFGQMKDAMMLKSKLAKMEKKIKKARLTGEAQSGAIKVVVNGAGEVLEVNIAEEMMQLDRKKELQKGLAYAFNQAREAAARFSQEEIEKLMKGLPPEMRAMLGRM